MGTPDFAVPSLRILSENGYTPIAVVTGPDRRRGRGQKMTPTAVKSEALRLGIETILQPENVRDPQFADQIRGLAADLIVVVAFRILPPEVFNAARLGAFNLHGSLLPKYRGAAPINWAILRGDTETGVTTFFLQQAVDTGSIILRAPMPIGPDETAGDVHDRMMHLGADAVLETVRRIEQGTAESQPQDDTVATTAPRIFRDDGHILWEHSATEVHNQIRGLSPVPGAWTHHDGVQIKIYRSRIVEISGEAGTVLETSDRLVIACGKDAVEAVEVQQEGRKRMRGVDFLRGYDLEVGSRLG